MSLKGGKSVIRVVSHLLNGKMACPGLIHVVFMTTVPFPLCNSEECNASRGFRNNAAISAINYMVISALMQATKMSGIRFSVVDAYSIIHPRLIVNEDDELACGCHYSCMVPNFLPGNAHKYFALISPGGYAVWLSMLRAMTSGVAENHTYSPRL